ncbi:Rv0361 family membrane protein [Glycomyces salinus]|uniref:Rv0361 family membrane protein n=1 Tax=Glycomyces salinus TaxID=980294 RepID=UPI0018EDF9E6|nr:DUF4878 domain-containing protein [Glycomyces salinus]
MDIKLRPARLTALASGACAIALALAACSDASDSPEGVVEAFIDDGMAEYRSHLIEGDAEAAVEAAADYQCAEHVEERRESAEEFVALTGEEREQAVERLEEYSVPDDYSYEIGEVTEDGDTATVEIEITADGETRNQTIDVVKEDDEWKVCGFGL